MTFRVIDKKTGKEPIIQVIQNIAKQGGLMEMDIDQFFVGENGTLALVDDCGNVTYCDNERFMVLVNKEDVNGEMNEHIHKIPCDSCAHNRVCTVKKCFVETEIKTTHPYIKVTLECTEYMRIVPNPGKLDAPCKAESEG